ncbi:MAG: hypothetical protein RSB35_08170, partial [Eubacterium sp.]
MTQNTGFIDGLDGQELSWDDEIEKDSSFALLPAGDYDFTVTDFERARHNGSAKLPPCNKAVVTLTINTPEGKASIKHNLFLHTKTEGMLCAFFTAIGQRKHGERIKMNWNNVIGATGKATVSVRDWTDNNGNTRQSNDIKKFIEPAEQPAKGFTP